MDGLFGGEGSGQKLCWSPPKLLMGFLAPCPLLLFLRLCKHTVGLRKHENVAGRVSSLKANDSLSVQVRKPSLLWKFIVTETSVFLHIIAYRSVTYSCREDRSKGRRLNVMRHVRNTQGILSPVMAYFLRDW